MTANLSILRRYDCISKLLEQADKSPKDGTCASITGGDWHASWSGSPSLEQAIEWARYGGWVPDVSSEFRDLFDAQLPKLRKYRAVELELGYHVSGGDVDVQRFLDGEPENMIGWLPTETMVSKRAFCVLVGHSISSGVTGKELFVRGQALIAMIRALQMLGFDLEIWSEETLGGRGGHYTTLTCLHHAGDIIDQGAIEFAIGNPSWLRRILFAAEETESATIRTQFGFKNDYGYGHPTAPRHQDTVGADITVDLGRSWFGESSLSNAEEVAKTGFDWVVKQLIAAGALEEGVDVS